MKNKQTNGPKNHAKQIQRNNCKIARPLRFASERAWSWTKLLRM